MKHDKEDKYEITEETIQAVKNLLRNREKKVPEEEKVMSSVEDEKDTNEKEISSLEDLKVEINSKEDMKSVGEKRNEARLKK